MASGTFRTAATSDSVSREETMNEDDAAFADAWREHRRYILDVAYRMLGSVRDAEDIVQEAFARLLRQDVDRIRDARGWLVVVGSRVSRDLLRCGSVIRNSHVQRGLPS